MPLKPALVSILILVSGGGVAAAEDFHGYPCTVDCSGHEAGYEWAERKGIDEPDDCGGNSNSFIEGCRAWAEEQEGDDWSDDGDDSSHDDEVEEGDDW